VKISAGLPVGVAALLFQSATLRRAVEAALVPRLETAGFAEVILPVLDYAEPYEALLDPARRAELYRFVARDGELLALRADFTPLLARLLAPRAASLTLPLRLFYRGDVVRFEEARAGRLREFYQLGAELLGEAGDGAEREMLELFVDLLVAGAERARQHSPAPPPALAVVLGFAGALDEPLRRAADPGAALLAVERRQRAALRRSNMTLFQVAEDGVPERPEDLGEVAAARYGSLLILRDELRVRHPGVRFTIDLAEFASQVLDAELATTLATRAYYDGLAFRAYAGTEAQPIGGGGRYDQLFRRLGATLPAVGFSLGLDRL
jgi:ATP phosphoribosyltransferase regulatory subunit